jgi:crotonobetainyl-CoA:carnitine CoA-transferase CaiB-like acyl-CoA transferase
MGYFRTVDHPELGTFETVGPPLQMSEHAMPANLPAPDLGADSLAVLRAAGLDEAEAAAALAPVPTPGKS